MTSTPDCFRDYMLSIDCRGRWQTTGEIVIGLRMEYGLRCLPTDILIWLREFGNDPEFTVTRRPRTNDSVTEYRMYRNASKKEG